MGSSLEIRFKNDVLPLKDRLFRLALRITLNREEAEDVVQDTLLKMWDRRQEWDSVHSLEAMAMTICHNRALDVANKAGRGNLMLDVERDARPTDSDPYKRLEDKEKGRVLRRIMDALPAVQRSIMEMRELEGKDYREIAEILGLEEGQVRVYLHRARQKVKEKFEKFF